MITLYLELEAIRFKDRLSFEIIPDDEIDLVDCKVPAMLIHPFVENAISHGLKNKPGHGHVGITLSIENTHIRCVVEDNGIGRKAAEEIARKSDEHHKSLGTAITESRLDLINELYGKNFNVVIEDLFNHSGNPAGTRVIIHLPILFVP